MPENDQPLPEDVRARLAETYGAELPDPRIRDRTLAALRAQGSFAERPRPRRSLPRAVAAAAAGVLLFLAGFWFGDRPPAGPVEAGSGLYLMLLREPPGGLVVEGTTEAELVREYGRWAGGLARTGNLVRGEKLREQAVRVGGDRTPEGPDASTISGFFLIRASDLAQARAIASTCPHVRYGGGIELRPIDPT